MAQHAEPAKIVCSVHEHEEDLQDEPFIFVAPTHLDHEEEDAKVVEVQALLDLLLGEILDGDPLVDLTPDYLSMYLVCFLVDCGPTFAYLLQRL